MPATEDEKSNWTIKGVPVGVRKRAISGATKRGESVATWLGRAVDALTSIEAGDQLIPPGQQAPPSMTPEAMDRLTRLLETTVAAAGASGVPLPKATARQAFALLDSNLRSARGLPPKKLPAPRKPPILAIEG